MICRKKCGENEYYDPKNNQNCFKCSDAISGCQSCQEMNGIVGNQVQCTDCGLVLTPKFNGAECVNEFCLVIDTVDDERCLQCMPGYYQDEDTSKCYAECPVGYVVLESEMLCVPPCDAGNFYNRDIMECLPCDSFIEGCTACDQLPNGDILCSSCEEELNLT